MQAKAKKTITTKTGRKIRRKHSGRLELRGRCWLARWMVNGKRFAQSTGETDRRKAEQWLERQLASVNATDVRTRSKKKIETLLEQKAAQLKGAVVLATEEREAELAALPSVAIARIDDEYQTIAYGRVYAASAQRNNTADNYHTSAVKFMSWISEHHPEATDMKQVTDEIALQFTDYINSHSVGSTARIRIFQLQKIWDTIAERYKSINDNPWKRIKKPDFCKSARRELTREELAKVAGVLHGEMLLCFYVGCFTGLRISDAAQLRWEHIDLAPVEDPEYPVIHLMPMKTRNREKWVTCPIVPELYAILTKIPKAKRHGYLMPEMADAYQRGSSNLSGRFVDAFKAAGIKTTTEDGRNICGFHALRHTFVSIAANAGIPFMIVQQIVGHSTAKMSAHYFHENRGVVARAFTKFPMLFNTAQNAPQLPCNDAIDAEVIDVPLTAADATEARFSRLRSLVAEMRTAGDDMEAALRVVQGIETNADGQPDTVQGT